MRIPRVYCPAAAGLKIGGPTEAAGGRVLELDEAESRHLIAVLRRAPGDLVKILPGDGTEWLAKIIEANPQAARVDLLPQRAENAGHGPRGASGGGKTSICLAMALTRGGAFEQALEQLAELGVDEIIPLICERCVVKIAGAAEARQKHERWLRILESAAKQCGRRTLPELAEIQKWSDWLESERSRASEDCVFWAAHPSEGATALFDAAADWAEAAAAPTSPRRAAIAIGPEGGFSPGEIESAARRGARLVMLPGHILRAPTAAAAAALTIRLAIETRP